MNHNVHLKSLSLGEYKLEPAFAPMTSTYHVKVPADVMKVHLKAEAQDSRAQVEIIVPDVDVEEKEDEGDGKGLALRTMKGSEGYVRFQDNSDIDRGESPRWTSTARIKVTSADNQMMMEYLVKAEQQVSNYSMLKGISVGTNTDGKEICKLHPEFMENVTEYTCLFDWTLSKYANFTFHLDKDKDKCDGCEVHVLSPVHSEGQLSLSYQAAEKVNWKLDTPWTRKFLYGEFHKLPVAVVSADKYTATTYNIYIERQAPWYMQTRVTRAISHTASTLGVIMSLSSATNFMAMAKQFQFMTLTTEIQGVPSAYEDFAKSLKIFSVDTSIVTDHYSFGLPTKKDIEKMKQNMIKNMGDDMGIENPKLLLEYCVAFHHAPSQDIPYANAILNINPKEGQKLVDAMSARAKRINAGQAKNASTPKDTNGGGKKDEKHGSDQEKKEEHDEQIRRLRHGNASRRLLNFMDSDKARSDLEIFTPSDSLAKTLRDLEDEEWDRRNLDDDKALHKDKEKGVAVGHYDDDSDGDRSGGDGDGGGKEKKKIEKKEEKDWEVWLWSEKQWRTLVGEHVNMIQKEHRVSDAAAMKLLGEKYAQISCQNEFVAKLEEALAMLHAFYQMRKMLKTTTGEFLLLITGIFVIGSLYAMYYQFLMKGKQKRSIMLEPGRLMIFILDYALIGFTTSAAGLLFKGADNVQLFSYTPPSSGVQMFCAVSLISYPLTFTIFMFTSMYWATRGFSGRDAQGMPVEQHLIWNKEFSQWTDPSCNDMKIVIEAPKATKFIPLLPALMTSHVRSCIPVLHQEGDELDFAAMEARKKKSKTDLRDERMAELAKVREMEASIEKELEDEIDNMGGGGGSSSKNSKKAKMIKERELKDKRKARTAKLKKEVDADLERYQKLAEVSPAPQPAWMPAEVAEDCLPCIAVAELSRTWKSCKNREETDRLDPEEEFALTQYIEQNINSEQRLLKYNILSVAYKEGSLVPKEPLKDEAKGQCFNEENEKAHLAGFNGMWLPETDYAYEKRVTDSNGKTESKSFIPTDDSNYGMHPNLHEYSLDAKKDNMHYIENDLGKRLVYGGHTRLFPWMARVAPGGSQGTKLRWLDEPEQGWAAWEREFLTKPTFADDRSQGEVEFDKDKGYRYADKWQWLAMEHWDQPWFSDSVSEGTVRCICKDVEKKNIPFYAEINTAILKNYRERVPYKIDHAEKTEMRKWMWTQLRKYTELKIKLGYMSDLNEKFYRNRRMRDIAGLTFHDVWFKIETAVPNPDEMLEDERHLSSTELAKYALMKLEDTYAYNEEPWWDGCDQPAEGEYKVRFDHDMFWKEPGDPELDAMLKTRDLVPRLGYQHCQSFTKSPDASVGTKRYRLLKPDGTSTHVDMFVHMKHILPLMKYTQGFKVNIPKQSLDMPYRSIFSIVVDGRANGEEFLYCVDRMSTLVSIVVLASKPNGLVSAVLFLCLRQVSFWLQLYTGYVSNVNIDKEEVHKKNIEKKEEKGDAWTSDDDIKSEKGFWTHVLSSLYVVDCTVLLLQSVTLMFLITHQASNY